MSEPSGSPAPGTTVGPYRIVREIAGGGMGVVLEAVDEPLDRPVALKLIAPDLAADDRFRRRFTREARALAALDSPHVVQVYGHGEVDGRLYLATQLIPDGDLGGALQRYGAPTTRVALDLVAQVAAGLADAHQAGLVHRDVKPGNVLLRRGSSGTTAYLADFGIARRLTDRADEEDAEDAEDQPGTLGTPGYLAPELSAGAAAGVATDVYALGCLLWATLTGRPPYAGATDDEVARGHAERPVPQLPGRSRQVVAVNRILRSALAKHPADRPHTAADIHDALVRAAALPHRRRPRPTPLAAAAAAGATAVVALVGIGTAARPADAPPSTPRTVGAVATTDPPAADVAVAVRHLTRALRDADPTLGRRRARCTAARWVHAVGLDRLRAEGYLTADLRYVDVDIGAVSARTRGALAAAAVACLGPGRPQA